MYSLTPLIRIAVCLLVLGLLPATAAFSQGIKLQTKRGGTTSAAGTTPGRMATGPNSARIDFAAVQQALKIGGGFGIPELDPGLRYNGSDLDIPRRTNVKLVLCPSLTHVFRDAMWQCPDDAFSKRTDVNRTVNVELLGNVITAPGEYRLFWYLPADLRGPNDPPRSEWSTPFVVAPRR